MDINTAATIALGAAVGATVAYSLMRKDSPKQGGAAASQGGGVQRGSAAQCELTRAAQDEQGNLRYMPGFGNDFESEAIPGESRPSAHPSVRPSAPASC